MVITVLEELRKQFPHAHYAHVFSYWSVESGCTKHMLTTLNGGAMPLEIHVDLNNGESVEFRYTEGWTAQYSRVVFNDFGPSPRPVNLSIPMHWPEVSAAADMVAAALAERATMAPVLTTY